MKKAVSVISAFALALSLCSPVLAENNNDEMRAVLKGVKARVEIPAECTEFSSGNRTSYGITEYDFSWNTKESEEYKYVRVECLADGTITSYSVNSKSVKDSPRIPQLTETEAKERAEDFVKKTNPDFPYMIEVMDEDAGSLYGTYSFSTQVYINEIPVDGTGRISVDGDTGKVDNYYLNYTPADYPMLDEAISADNAKKAYSEKLGLKLVYKTYTDDDNNDRAYPAYVQKETGERYINALTGDVIDISEGRMYRNMYAAGSASMKESADDMDAGFSEQEISELENVKGLISKEDIEKQLRENKTLNVPSEMVLSHIGLSKQYNRDEYTYNMSMNSENTYIHASFNAKTGELLSYNRNSEDMDGKAEFCNDKAVEALAGDKAGEYEYSEENGYQRMANGVPVEGDRISVNTVDGTVTYYYISYTDTEFPSLDEVISTADAEKVMFDKNGYDMVYKLSFGENEITPIAVYEHKYTNINALTGKAVGYNGEEETDSGKIEYSDIDNHYAKQIIETLAHYGIGFEGGEFKPDEKITQKDYISLLTAINQNHMVILKDDTAQYESVYSNALRRNIISKDERDDNAVVTRETASVYMIRAVGAEQYAKFDDIFVRPFKDVTKNKGYIALLSAMGIVSGNGDGTFNPQREITRAESAVMIYNYLTR